MQISVESAEVALNFNGGHEAELEREAHYLCSSPHM